VFELEISGLVLRRERRTSSWGFARTALAIVAELAIELGEPPGPEDRAAAFALAERARIGFFDAMYLIHAAERGALLATRDRGMLTAAPALGIEVVDLR
jgi:predicted nucleic acid-binding protein